MAPQATDPTGGPINGRIIVVQKTYLYMQCTHCITAVSLRWRRNGHDGVSNHQPHDCLLNRLFRRRSKKTPKLRVTGLCSGNSPGPVNSPHKWTVTRKMFPFDDVIMSRSYFENNHFGNYSHANGLRIGLTLDMTIDHATNDNKKSSIARLLARETTLYLPSIPRSRWLIGRKH